MNVCMYVCMYVGWFVLVMYFADMHSVVLFVDSMCIFLDVGVWVKAFLWIGMHVFSQYAFLLFVFSL